ncbi:MAG: hypothetical protein CVU59_13295, partial [Deltaproteobacteria bacterium HGW-Deltaproteobacteria-17]
VREEVLDGVFFAPTYGNTLMGLAVGKPFADRLASGKDGLAVGVQPIKRLRALHGVDECEGIAAFDELAVERFAQSG